MATETLKLEITANNKAAVAALKETTSQLDAVGSHATATTNKLGSLSKGSNQAANSLHNLGLIAQDAPFGFIAIQNNFNPLLESFQRLKVETGSTGRALKVLGGTLMGAGGLGFALSAASALFLVFGDSIFGAGEKAKETKNELDELNKSATADVAQMKALVAAAQDASLSQDQRRIAIEKLKSQYPSYFKDLTTENSLNISLTSSTENLTKAIYKRAQAKAYEAQITEKTNDLLKTQSNIEELRNRILVNRSLKEAERRKLGNRGLTTSAAAAMNDPAGMNAYLKAVDDEKRLSQELDKALTKEGKTKLELANIQQKLNKEIAETIDLESTKPPPPPKTDYGTATRAYGYQPPKSQYNDKRVQSSATAMPGVPQGDVRDNSAVQSAMEVARALEAQKGALAAYNEYMTEAGQITNFAAQAFTDLGNAMLQGQNLGDALGNVFKKLAADIAAAAIKALIFQTILSAISGGSSTAVAGAAGKSGGGFGKLFKGFLGLGKGFAEGGIASGPKSGHLQLLHGTEAIFPMDKLAAYTDRAISAGMNMGGMGGPQRIVVEGRLAGNDIWLSQRRTEFTRSLTT